MRSFDQFLAMLNEIPDPRRAEGKLYKLPYILLFSVGLYRKSPSLTAAPGCERLFPPGRFRGLVRE